MISNDISLNKIRVILVQPSHPGNIGAAARAMKVMGISELYLVNPKLFPNEAAIRMAAGADDILQQAVVVSSLPEALGGVVMAFATSARSRHLEWPMCSPKECGEQAAKESQGTVALVFGREHAGLTNDELSLCHKHVHINTDPGFSSLNLAAAVQVLCYEVRMACLELSLIKDEGQNIKEISGRIVNDPNEALAHHDEVLSFMNYLEQLLVKINVLNPDHPKMLMKRLYRLFARARLKKNEINILRGIFKSLDNK